MRAHTLTLSHANMHSDTRAVHVRVCLSDGGDRKEGGGQAGGWEEKRGSKRKVSEQGQRELTGAGGITSKREIWHDEKRDKPEARSGNCGYFMICGWGRVEDSGQHLV